MVGCWARAVRVSGSRDGGPLEGGGRPGNGPPGAATSPGLLPPAGRGELPAPGGVGGCGFAGGRGPDPGEGGRWDPRCPRRQCWAASLGAGTGAGGREGSGPGADCLGGVTGPGGDGAVRSRPRARCRRGGLSRPRGQSWARGSSPWVRPRLGRGAGTGRTWGPGAQGRQCQACSSSLPGLS